MTKFAKLLKLVESDSTQPLGMIGCVYFRNGDPEKKITIDSKGNMDITWYKDSNKKFVSMEIVSDIKGIDSYMLELAKELDYNPKKCREFSEKLNKKYGLTKAEGTFFNPTAPGIDMEDICSYKIKVAKRNAERNSIELSEFKSIKDTNKFLNALKGKEWIKVVEFKGINVYDTVIEKCYDELSDEAGIGKTVVYKDEDGEERFTITGQLEFLGYEPKEEVFVAGFMLWADDDYQKIVKFKIESESNLKILDSYEDSAGIYKHGEVNQKDCANSIPIILK
ncbi:TPA: hypothetical protein SFZ43_000111 [Campylobacter jejuni]|nr:hypothetical protein [Campylobacter jejuni]